MSLTMSEHAPHRLVTEVVSFGVPTMRHGVVPFTGTLTIINDFTYMLEVSEFPGETAGTESKAEAIELLADRLIGILDAQPCSYWCQRGILPAAHAARFDRDASAV